MCKLLKFCQDLGDEMNIIALAVMTENELTEWSGLKAGIENPKYQEELELYENNEKIRNDYFTMLRTKGYRYNSIPKEDIEAWNLQRSYSELSYVEYPKRIFSYIDAYVGNFDQDNYFAENFSDYLYMRELVSADVVEVFDISEDFYNTFQIANLSKLSTCNVFEIDSLKYRDENR